MPRGEDDMRGDERGGAGAAAFMGATQDVVDGGIAGLARSVDDGFFVDSDRGRRAADDRERSNGKCETKRPRLDHARLRRAITAASKSPTNTANVEVFPLPARQPPELVGSGGVAVAAGQMHAEEEPSLRR